MLPCLEVGKLSQYTGESGRSTYTRGLEHESHLSKKTRGQPLADHARLTHPGLNLQAKDFQMQVTGQYRGAVSRLISEGIQVEKIVKMQREDPKNVEVLNSKLNFNQARPVRLITSDKIFT